MARGGARVLWGAGAVALSRGLKAAVMAGKVVQENGALWLARLHADERLMLNVLFSFAQFEREIIGERTRDKMAAARKKGKWIGGQPVLGYDIDREAKKLVVNRNEASLVRTIFSLYLRLQSILAVLKELKRRGAGGDT